MITRRTFLKGAGGLALGTAAFGGYAVAEPWRTAVTSYRVSPPNWPKGLTLRIAALADLHVCEPWMSLKRVRTIVEHTNAMQPDAIVLLGDYVAGAGMSRISDAVPDQAWADVLGRLSAPFGVHAVLGNHDWWEDEAAQRRRSATTAAERALAAAGIPVHNNSAVRLAKNGDAFWIAGLADQWAYANVRRAGVSGIGAYPGRYLGLDDLAGTLKLVGDKAPVILLAHEPDIFPKVPDRVALTLCGHTHGGQINFMGFAPRVPSIYGRRYTYGHIVENGRNLIVSGGLGCSFVPVRFGVPPEIVMVELTA